MLNVTIFFLAFVSVYYIPNENELILASWTLVGKSATASYVSWLSVPSG